MASQTSRPPDPLCVIHPSTCVSYFAEVHLRRGRVQGKCGKGSSMCLLPISVLSIALNELAESLGKSGACSRLLAISANSSVMHDGGKHSKRTRAATIGYSTNIPCASSFKVMCIYKNVLFVGNKCDLRIKPTIQLCNQEAGIHCRLLAK